MDCNASYTIGSTTYYETAYTSCYVDVHSTVVPYSPPVAAPEYKMIGLLALIGILTIALAFATLRRKR